MRRYKITTVVSFGVSFLPLTNNKTFKLISEKLLYKLLLFKVYGEALPCNLKNDKADHAFTCDKPPNSSPSFADGVRELSAKLKA